MRKLGLLIALFLAVGCTSAQSLKSEDPYPLKAGINNGISDSFVGTQYWYFYATPEKNQLAVRLKKPMAIYGAPQNTVLTVTLYDEKRTWKVTKVATSNKTTNEATFIADKVDKKMKILVSVAPPNQNLIRLGGEYEIEVTGDAQFDEVKNTADPIIRTYYKGRGAVKFLADGTVEAADGSSGTWKVFDSENHIYTVVIEGQRFSVKYHPGYGLARPDDPYMIVFQEVRR